MAVHKIRFIFATLISLLLIAGTDAGTLDFTIPESQRSWQDGSASLLSFKIEETDVSRGTLLSPDGTSNIGSYAFSNFATDPSLNGIDILKIETTGSPQRAYLFLSQRNKTSLTYLGWSDTFQVFGNEIDTNQPGWNYMAKFLTAPLSEITSDLTENAAIPLNIYLAQMGYMPRDMQLFFGQSTGVPREVYFSIFMNRLIDSIVANPSLSINIGVQIPIRVNLSDYPVVSANQRYAIVNKVVANWAKLSTANKIFLVENLADVDGRSLNLLADPVTNLIKTTDYSSEWGRLTNTIRKIGIDPEVTITKKTALFTAVTNSYNSQFYLYRNAPVLQLLKEITDDADGISLNKADYQGLLKTLAMGTIEYYRLSPNLLQFRPEDVLTAPAYVIENFPELIPPGSEMLSIYNSVYAAKRAAVLQSTFQQESFQEIETILRDYKLLNTDALVRSSLDKAIAKVSSNFNAEKMQDFFKSNEMRPIDRVVLAMVKLMKKKNIYDDAKWITPLIRLYNPKVVGESDTFYQQRKGQVTWLWNYEKVLMFDIFGGMANGGMKYGNVQNYTKAFQDFARSHPMLLDIAFLRNYGNVTANDGVIYMNWFAYETPSVFTKTIFHEGAHATEYAFKAKTPWKIMQDYFFQKNYADPNAAIVSAYSLFNTRENHAEILAAWHSDGMFWLRTALERFKAGDKRLLNQLLVIALNEFDGVNGMTNLKDRIRIVTILEDGTAVGSPLVGGWLNETNGALGNMNLGWYRFYLDGQSIKVRFNKSIITQIIDGTTTYK